MKLIILTASSMIGLFSLCFNAKERTNFKEIPEVQVSHTYCEEGDDEDPQPALSGRITDNTVAKNPIHHACVEIKTTGGVFVSIIGSDASGHYYFNTVPAGNYNLVVSASGFTTKTVPITLTGTPASIDVEL